MIVGNIFIIKSGIKSEFINDIVNFFISSGRADDAASFNLGDLPDDGTDGTSGTRDKYGSNS